MLEETHIQLSLQAQFKQEEGKYKVILISAGNGNGWEFSADVLKDSLKLWDKSQCFIDHSWFGHSVRDLCAVFSEPVWDEEEKGVSATFNPFGPAAEVAVDIAEDVFSKPDLSGGVGFSADINFTATGRTVKQIIKVFSTDLVINPARGGKWLRALNSIHEQRSKTMDHDETTNTEERTALELQGARETAAELEEHKKQSQEILRMELSNLLDNSLSMSKLPAPMQDAIRVDFSDGEQVKLYKPKDLQTRIERDREMLSKINAPTTIQGPSRLSGFTTGGDQFEAAVFDLMGAPRPEKVKNVQAPRLSGIREMYTLATGDVYFRGGAVPDNIRVQFNVSTDLPALLVDALNVSVHDHWNRWAEAGYGWWQKIVNIEQAENMHDLKGVVVGQVDLLPTVAEGDPYLELDVTDNKETAAFGKVGAYLGITLEMFMKDDTRKLRAFPRILGSSGVRTISAKIAAIFTANAGVGPTMSDTKALFHIDHGNLGSTALGTDGVAWLAAQAATYNQTMLAPAGDDGGIVAIDAQYLLVPRALKHTALEIMLPSDTTKRGLGSPDDVVVVPEWTDDTDWAAVSNPALVPAITFGHLFGVEPEIYIAGNPLDYSVFMNDESRIKARHISAILVEDFRGVYKSNVAG